MDTFDHQDGSDRAIPVTILTGFLGAGKTTLLNRILNGEHGLRVAVMVNDFGAVNIDSSLVVGMDDQVISLSNGCICCQINDDLVRAVTGLMERSERPEYILIEASGIADPSSIAMTFTTPRFRSSIRLDSVTSIVDAEQVFAFPKLEQLKLRQIAFSDLLILNKMDRVDRQGLARIKAWLGKHFRRIRIIESTYAEVPLEVLISVGRFDPAQLENDRLAQSHDGQSRNRHHHQFATWSYESDRPLRLAKLRRAAAALPENIYRVKGVVHSIDAPDRRAVLQVVGRRVDVALLQEWGEDTPRTQIVAIGAPGSLDTELLREKFDACQ